MTKPEAEKFYKANRDQIEKDLIMVNGQVCAIACGVGRSKIGAVRTMLGIPDNTRKIFVGTIRKFLKRYPDFQTADAKNIENFKKRHPEL